MNTKPDVATCRGCGRELRGKPYGLGGFAFHPETGDQCKVNFYGGWVCSPDCDRKAVLEMESSMPGAGPAKHMSTSARERYNKNWSKP